MRKFIVKHFALYYHFTLFGKRITSLRASRIIVPTLLLCFFLLDRYNLYVDIIAFYLIFVTIWLGFRMGGIGYFSLWPITWHELDTVQKYYYGKLDIKKLTQCQFAEWEYIVKKIDKK